MNKLYFILSLLLFSFINVNADTYSTNNNLFENTYTNNLIDMANSQIDNFSYKKYVIFQYDYNYYLVSSNEYSVSSNSITFHNSHILSAIRYQNNYNYYYSYSSFTESDTIINFNNIIISNIDTPYSISSKRFSDYNYYFSIKNIGIFVLGLLFAIFLTKERSYL